MGFMGMFGGKETTGGETGDWGSDQVGMMKGRINQLLSLTEEKRQESIRDMIGAFNSPQVKPKARESLVATRVEILGELPEEKRRTIISSRTTALKVPPELDQADRQVQERVMHQVSQRAREAFLTTWQQVTKSMAS